MHVVVKQAVGRGISTAVAWFAVSFLLTAGLIGLLIRDPLHLHADVRSEKLAMMEEWRGKAWTAAFGSSHVHYGFDPRVFDRAVQGSALATRSVNLAVEGGSQSEQRAMALAYLKGLRAPAASAGRQACLVVLELNAGANFTNDHLVHPRSINIYDWATLRFVSHLVDPAMSMGRKIGRIGYAVAATGLHYLNVGMLSNEIFAPPLDQELLDYQMSEDRRGIKEAPVSAVMTEKIQKLITEAKQPAVVRGDMTRGNDELVRELASSSGVPLSFVYIVMPKIDDLASYPVYPSEMKSGGRVVPIIDLARPDLYPQLYHAELWSDTAHLNVDGAALATTMIADQLKQWYAVHGGPDACGGSVALR